MQLPKSQFYKDLPETFTFDINETVSATVQRGFVHFWNGTDLIVISEWDFSTFVKAWDLKRMQAINKSFSDRKK